MCQGGIYGERLPEGFVESICSQAGVTTGALYFFFEDKNDLFYHIVADVLDSIERLTKEHFLEESKCVEEHRMLDFHPDDERELSENIVHTLYGNREEMLLLLTKAQGSEFEHITDRFISWLDMHNQRLVEGMCHFLERDELPRNVTHWLSHMQLEMYVYMVTHIEKEEDAIVFGRYATDYLIGGWYHLFQLKVPGIREDE